MPQKKRTKTLFAHQRYEIKINITKYCETKQETNITDTL